jgi:TolB-like protein/Flp pilus assembly protein TadD
MVESLHAFGPFVFDAGRGMLQRNGKPVAVAQRGLALLAALFDANGEVVSKADLMSRGWPGTIVEEGNLTVQIAALRKALGPGPDGQEWIATVSRVGYRLVRPRAVSGVEDATLWARPTLAVLPFVNLGGDREQDYFADGLVEDLITALSRFRSFAVIARNSSFVYKGRSVDVRQVARELGVRYVLEGSVRRAGSRLRIAAQLIDGTSGSHLWAQNFDGVVADIFDVQDSITESVVAIVEPRIQRAEIERSRRERPDSVDAYDLCLRGLQKLDTTHPDANAAALELFDRAIAIEPGYATALAAAAIGLEHRITMGWPPLGADDGQKSVRLARAALAAGGDDAMVMARCGIVLLQLGEEGDQAMRLFNRALDVNPNNVGVLALAGIGNMIAGSLDDALAIFQRVIRLNPGDTYEATSGIAHAHLRLGRFDAALDWAERSLSENPNYNPAHWVLIAANAHLGRLTEARRALAALQALAPGITLAHFIGGRHDDLFNVMVEGLRLAGMPEA